MIDVALLQRLSAFGGLTALISDRIYPVMLPEKVTLPALVYSKVTGSGESAFGADSDLHKARYTLLAQSSKSPLEAKQVAKQAELATKRYRGTLDSTVIQDIFIENDGTDFYDAQARIYYCAIDIIIHYLE
jgi:hypothetical protein